MLTAEIAKNAEKTGRRDLGMHPKKHITARKPAALIVLGALWLTLACGVLEQAPDATRQAQQTARAAQLAGTQLAVDTEVAIRNDSVRATMTVWKAARDQELSVQLTALSTELKVAPSGGNGEALLTRWLTNPACQPPCWENITPGVTPIDEAVKIVYQIPGVDIIWLPSMEASTEDRKSIKWKFGQSGYGWVSAEGGQEIVSTIMLGASEEQALQLSAVLAAYGNPSTVVRGSCHGGGLSGATCNYSLVFREKGMELDLGIHAYKKVDIQADTEAGRIYFYPLTGERLNPAGIEWSGYGQYDFRDR